MNNIFFRYKKKHKYLIPMKYKKRKSWMKYDPLKWGRNQTFFLIYFLPCNQNQNDENFKWNKKKNNLEFDCLYKKKSYLYGHSQILLNRWWVLLIYLEGKDTRKMLRNIKKRRKSRTHHWQLLPFSLIYYIVCRLAYSYS